MSTKTKNYSSSEVGPARDDSSRPGKFSTRLNDKLQFEVAVIGAGPAGIMAAIYAAKAGKKVVLLEKNEYIGRKILATGNGRCNITNKNIDLNRYHGENASFAKPILANFNQSETLKFFESIGVSTKEEDRGRLFPTTDKASTVVDALETELKRLNVTIYTRFTVKKITSPSLSSLVANPGISPDLSEGDPRVRSSSLSDEAHLRVYDKDDRQWHITAENDQIITAKALILTTGGKAAHQFGSSGDGLFWAKNFGHTIIPIHAALVPIETEQDFVKEIMGIKLKVHATLLSDNKPILEREGDLLLTHYGVSGPAAMGLAREIDPLLHLEKKVEISIDLLPEKTKEELDNEITSIITIDGKKNIKNVISEFLPKNISPLVLRLTGTSPDKKAAEISRKQRGEIISKIKDFRLTIKRVRPLKEAQVMAGGVATAEVNPDLESKIIPSLYFAGEILDIDGDSGGFNLQWAWSSGKVAGQSAAGNING